MDLENKRLHENQEFDLTNEELLLKPQSTGSTLRVTTNFLL